MRIVAGSAKGRALQGPKTTSRHIRPTADRVRETLFNVLGQLLEGQEVLDLYAGTGALALEALSRGAGRAVLVDSDREALALVPEKPGRAGVRGAGGDPAQPVARAVEALRPTGRALRAGLRRPAVRGAGGGRGAGRWSRAGLLAPGGHAGGGARRREAAPESHGGFERVDSRRFGDTLVSLYHGIP